MAQWIMKVTKPVLVVMFIILMGMIAAIVLNGFVQ